MNLNDMSIGKRLGLSFLIIIMLIIGLASLSYVQVDTLDDDIRITNEDRYPKAVWANNIKDALNETARATRNILLMTDAAQINGEFTSIADDTKTITENLAKLEKSVTSDAGKALFAQVIDARSKFVPLREKFLALAKAGKMEEAKPVLMTEVRPAQLAYLTALDKLIALQGKLMEDSGKESARAAASTKLMIMALALVAVALSVLIAFLVTRRITAPLAEAVGIARRVAGGDLTSDIRVTSKDETGQLLQALKDMNSSLISIVSEVRTGTDTIATASSQIASGNQDLSSRTEEQASSLEETAASMEELASTVRQNTDNAKQANQLAQSSSEVAQQGGVEVGQVVQTMDRINASARKIVDIISVIDGIAFQTNILALNAAVEAARAGEQGRGFAVVASEVRNLAQRSAAAAKEIKQLIDASVESVEAGTAQVARAGTTMNEVVASVKRVTDIMGEIASASMEQSTGIDQVNQAVTQMDEVTQQNAALVEEAAAAAESLQDQSAALAQVVSVFKLNGMQAKAARPTPVRAAAPRAAAPVRRSPAPAKRLSAEAPKPAIANNSSSNSSSGKAGDDWEEF